ncbi:MAG: PKD domain-containing protein [Candidatus Woesearchaeota archaeon]
MISKKGQFFIVAAVLIGLLLVAFLLNQLTFKVSQPVREESAINLFNNLKDKSKRTVVLTAEKFKEDKQMDYSEIENNLKTFKDYSLKQCNESYLDCELDFKLEGNIVLFDLTVRADDLYLHDEFKQKIEKKKTKVIADAGDDKYANLGERMFFDASGSFSSRKIVSYVWDFGDGTTGEGENVEHIYEKEGTYTIKLTITDENGLTDEDEITATVTKLDIFADAGADRKELIDTMIIFSGKNSYSTKGEIISYTWDFGDGTSAEGTDVSHSYSKEGTYVVTLVIKDSQGNTAIDTATIEVTTISLQPPVAEAGEEKQGTIGQELTFDGSKSYDLDGEIVKYIWDFGDGTSAEGMKVIHSYSKIGEYVVKLTVIDNSELTDTDTTLLTIEKKECEEDEEYEEYECEEEGEIKADAGPDQESIVGKEVCFDAKFESTYPYPIVHYLWDFGEKDDDDRDDDKKEGKNVCHTYNSKGAYTVKLKIIDSHNNKAEDTATVKIKEEEKKEEKEDKKICSYQDSIGFKTALESITDKDHTISVRFSTTAIAVPYSLSHIVFGLESCAYETAKKTAGSNPSWPTEIVKPDPRTKVNGLKYDETELIRGQTAYFSFEIPKECLNSMQIATKAGNMIGYITMPKSCFTLS